MLATWRAGLHMALNAAVPSGVLQLRSGPLYASDDYQRLLGARGITEDDGDALGGSYDSDYES